MKRRVKLIIGIILISLLLTSCQKENDSKTIVRISHNQSTNHPSHKGLLAFKEYVEGKTDKYEIQIYPSELLGSQTNMVELTQTGAIQYCIASNAILETFDKRYEIFNLPYLFDSPEVYHAVMDDKSITDSLFKSTRESGFESVTWLDAGTRNFYTMGSDKPINKPEDLHGLKIRVQQSPTNIRMMELLGGSATAMGFGDVYTSLQSGIIDGAENNELALTDNRHGEVCKNYSYDMHQMVPDIFIGNTAFLDSLPEEDKKIFEEGYEVLNRVQREEWEKAVEASKKEAQEKMKVNFIYPDMEPFKKAVMPLHQEVLDKNPEIKPIYDKIQVYNKDMGGK